MMLSLAKAVITALVSFLSRKPFRKKCEPPAMQMSGSKLTPERKLISPRSPTNDRFFAVDALNVACDGRENTKGTPPNASLAVLLTLLIALVRIDNCFWCVFDTNARFAFRKSGEKGAEAVFDKLLANYRHNFFQIPAGQADQYVIAHSHEYSSRIISLDHYTDYYIYHPWLRVNEYLIGLTVVRGVLRVRDLHITEKVKTDIHSLYSELTGLLDSTAEHSRKMAVNPNSLNLPPAPPRKNVVENVKASIAS